MKNHAVQRQKAGIPHFPVLVEELVGLNEPKGLVHITANAEVVDRHLKKKWEKSKQHNASS